MTKRKYISSSVIAAGMFLMTASSAFAATAPKLEVSGWMPYWRGATSTADVLPHLSQMTEVNPFGYTVKSDGTLYDALGVDTPAWSAFMAAAKAQKVRVIPTVMWSDTPAIHRILSNTKSRIALEDAIVAEVKARGYDGIDIDFEGKRAEDKNYFSTFLKGLYQRMGKKWVMCTIESRTPLDSRYDGVPPADATVYANDFVAINKYCDRVRLMTYDQQTIDLKLNAASAAKNMVYAPVSDPLWVEKVIKLVSQTIPKKKLVIGVATYGYEWDVTAYADGFTYDLLWSFNPRYATDMAAQYGIIPARNAAGEMSFSYVPNQPAPASGNDGTSSSPSVPVTSFAPAGTSSGHLVAAGALAYASSTNSHTTFRVMWWSDAKAINDKIELAKKLGVRGIAIFKLDGGEDQNLWNYLPKVR